MSYLARLKQLESRENLNNSPQMKLPELPEPPKPPFGSFGSTNPAYKNKNFSNVSTVTPEHITVISAWLTYIGEPEKDQCIVLNKCERDPEALAYYLGEVNKKRHESRRQKVIKLLTENPDKKRDYVTDTTADPENVILTFAIRGLATFDMLIPTNKYDPLLLQEIIKNEPQ